MTIDRMLPGVDGLAIIRQVRDAGIDTPALIISALGEIDDRVLLVSLDMLPLSLVRDRAFLALAARLPVSTFEDLLSDRANVPVAAKHRD
jgi:CheY-like chemotaxis protein